MRERLMKKTVKQGSVLTPSRRTKENLLNVQLLISANPASAAAAASRRKPKFQAAAHFHLYSAVENS